MVQKEKKYITWEGLNQHAKNVGKKIKEYDAGVIGGYNGSFPLTAATKGNIYLLPATKKYYVCIENYNGSQLTAPNANFEELSVYTNRSKLDNLEEYYIFDKSVGDDKVYDISSYIKSDIYFYIIYDHGIGLDSTYAFGLINKLKNNIKINSIITTTYINYDNGIFTAQNLKNQNLRLILSKYLIF